MAAKTRAQLLEELNASVRSAGQGGLTTAQDLRTFLTTLIDEIVASSGDGAGGAAEGFLFQLEPKSGEAGPCQRLTAAQAQQLAENYGATVDLQFTDPDTADQLTVTISYDLASGKFRSEGYYPGTSNEVQIQQQSDEQAQSGQLPETSNQVQMHSVQPEAGSKTSAPETSSPVRVYLVGHGPLASTASPRNVRLEFAFAPGAGDEQTHTVVPKQAGTYHRYEAQQVDAVNFFINKKATELPFELTPADELRVAVKHTDPDLYAVVILQG